MRPWSPDPHDSVKYLRQNKDYVCQKKKLIQIKSSVKISNPHTLEYTLLTLFFQHHFHLKTNNKMGWIIPTKWREPKPAKNNTLILNKQQSKNPTKYHHVKGSVIAALGGALSFLLGD